MKDGNQEPDTTSAKQILVMTNEQINALLAKKNTPVPRLARVDPPSATDATKGPYAETSTYTIAANIANLTPEQKQHLQQILQC